MADAMGTVHTGSENMTRLDESLISRAILDGYHEKLSGRIVSDVLIVGAGPSGLTAAFYLARQNLKVAVLEKRLSPGGGIWGGAIGMNEIVLQDDALAILQETGVRYRHVQGRLYALDAMELASGLCFKAIQSGAVLFNLMTVEDVCVHDGKVTGAVVNRTGISPPLPIDPLVLSGRAIVDATGHDAAVVAALRRRGLLKGSAVAEEPGEGPLDAATGERFVVEKVAEVYPGLWVSGMSVCTTFAGPRMGPIFGGMLLSGKRVAGDIARSLGSASQAER